MCDRWVYSDTPREVEGDSDAIVCVVDRSSFLWGQTICCCQVKHLKEMFSYARLRDEAFKRGYKVDNSPSLVDDETYMDIIGSLIPDMWKKSHNKWSDSHWECRYKEGVTKENFSDCCKYYNYHKNLWCEFDGKRPTKHNGKYVRYQITEESTFSQKDTMELVRKIDEEITPEQHILMMKGLIEPVIKTVERDGKYFLQIFFKEKR